MWRDIERRAEMYQIPLRVPAPYPIKQSVVANRVAIVGFQEGWGQDFVRAAYRGWFQLGQESGSEPNLSVSIREAGQNPERVLNFARTDQTNRVLEAETSEARRLGIFGSPTFVVENELFWGDDRLSDAISWYERLRRQARA